MDPTAANPGRPGNATEQEQTDRNRNRTQAMNVDREDELRIQAPPGQREPVRTGICWIELA